MAIPVIAGVIMKVAGPIIVQKLGKKLTKAETDNISAQVVQEIVDQVTADPVVKNELNAEAPYQSRVGVGGATGFIGGLGVLVPIVAGWLGYDIQPDRIVEIGFAILAVWGPSYALYGRFKAGLKPLFSRG